MVGNSTEKLEPAGTRRNIHDGLKLASLTAPNLSEESGLRVKLAPLSHTAQRPAEPRNWRSRGPVSCSPQPGDPAKEQYRTWAEWLPVPRPHALSTKTICYSFTSPFQTLPVCALRMCPVGGANSAGNRIPETCNGMHLPVQQLSLPEGFQQQNQLFFIDIRLKVIRFFLLELCIFYPFLVTSWIYCLKVVYNISFCPFHVGGPLRTPPLFSTGIGPATLDPITPISFGLPHSVAMVPPVRSCLQRKAITELSRDACGGKTPCAETNQRNI